ncbi:nucleotide exchange factor SIL1 [Condylostylus longicornis]|uniref:nucleotide exchange factor SIL1 n=1 Tax=Condylostylus longicornis TaxID=2530218 RepID=UPI00244E0F4C|nr:nucleotide exchange factor SIL1 [Condylostylus longicornis]
MKNENSNSDLQHPRIDSLQALLRFAIQQTKSEDAPHESVYEQMDPERRKFLENALKSWTVDIMEELEKAVKILESAESSVDEKLQSLEMIEELAGDIDLANNFLKIGGANIIILCLNSEDSRIKTSAIELVGEISQNNPFAQSHFTEIDMIPRLIKFLNDSDNNVIKSTLHAISCLVRRYEPALAIYVEKDGLEMILDCIKRKISEEKILTKAAFLVDALSIEFPEVREQFLKLGAIEILFYILKESLKCYDGNYSAKVEHILSALKTLSESSKAKERLKVIENVQSTLNQILDLCHSKDECEEIISHSKYILNIFNNDVGNVSQTTGPPSYQVSIWQDRTKPTQ